MKTYKIFFLDHRTYCINSLGDSLAQLGYEVFFQSSWNLEEVDAGLRYFRPDILITVGYNTSLFSYFADLIPALCKKFRLFHIYWATEDKINHSDWSLPYVLRAKPDLVWTIHADCIGGYEKLGIPCRYFNFALNPRLYPQKHERDEENYNISLVGATHLFKPTYRFESLQNLLFPLIKANIQTHIWGYGWRKNQAQIKETFGHSIPRLWLQGHLLYGNTSRVYRTSKIVLGLQNAQDQVTQRTFEILGTGAFMLTNRTEALSQLFIDGQELALTSSPAETLELVQYYLDRPWLRYEIGQRARQKVLENHTYNHRIASVWPHFEQVMLLK